MNNFRNVRIRLFNGREAVPCFWCHETLTLDDSTLDHVIGMGEGGRLNHRGKNNVVLSCGECNQLRAVLQNHLRTKRKIQTAREHWPCIPRIELAQKLKHLRASLQSKRLAIKAAEKVFQERCKIKLCNGEAGMIYPVDPVPEMSPLKEEMVNAGN